MRLRDNQIKSLDALLKELAIVLKDLNILENFRSFQITATIPAGTELRIRNELRIIPKTMIVNKQVGNGLITASTTEWTLDYLYIYNHGASSVDATVTFTR